VQRFKLPYYEGESEQCDTSQRGTRGIDRDGSSPGQFRILFSITSGFSPFMLFDQRRACRENGWERKKQPSHHRPKCFGDDAGDCGDEPPKHETNRIFIPLGFAHRRKVEVDLHCYRNQAKYSAKDTPNQIGTAQRVTTATPAL